MPIFCAREREAAFLFVACIPNLQEIQHADETKAPAEEQSPSEPQGVASVQSAQSAPAAAALDCHSISLAL